MYCIDTGFITQLGFSFSEDKGRILENIVFLELKRNKEDIYYFSEKRECDFLLRKKTKIYNAIQVCFELNDDNKEREINGLTEAMDKFKLNQGMILTYDQDEKIRINGKIIIVKPVWKWLLG